MATHIYNLEKHCSANPTDDKCTKTKTVKCLKTYDTCKPLLKKDLDSKTEKDMVKEMDKKTEAC